MTNIVLVPVTGGSNISAMNSNFSKVEEAINNDVLNLKGGNNVMLQDVDMNGNELLNVGVDVNNPGSMLTVGAGDSRYYNINGDTLAGPMSAGGQHITNLPLPVQASEPVRKGEFDTFVSTLTSTAGAFQQEGTGAVVRAYQDKMRDVVSIMDFGAIGGATATYHPLSERFATLAAAQAQYPFVGALTQSIDWAAMQAAVNTGKVVYAPTGKYVMTDPVIVPASSGVLGDGHDMYTPYASALVRDVSGTQFLAYGDAFPQFSVRHISNADTSGGVLANPSAADPYTATAPVPNYSLYNFTNANAVGTTPAIRRLTSQLSKSRSRHEPRQTEKAARDCVILIICRGKHK